MKKILFILIVTALVSISGNLRAVDICVTSTADTEINSSCNPDCLNDQCSLRGAVGIANPGDKIKFSSTIVPGNQIILKKSLSLNQGNIEITGNTTYNIIIKGIDKATDCVEINSNNNIISNLVFQNCKTAISIKSTRENNKIFSNYIGLENNGISATSTTGNDVGIEVAGNNNYIGSDFSMEPNKLGNFFAYNKVNILLSGDKNVVAGNFIGFGNDGITSPAGYRDDIGIKITFNGNRIGIDKTGYKIDPNYISNQENGIYIENSNQNIISGNVIGLNKDGAKGGSGNTRGIYLYCGSSENIVGKYYINDAVRDPSGIEIFGKENIISGNATGIVIYSNVGPNCANNSKNEIAGNFIGTDFNGNISTITKTAGNTIGINLDTGSNNTTVGSRGIGNTISNNQTGIIIYSDSNSLFDNKIGISAVGNTSAKNTTGIDLRGSKNLIGDENNGNSIDGSTSFAISILTGTENIITNNTIGNFFANKNGIYSQCKNSNACPNDVIISLNKITNNTSYGVRIFDDAGLSDSTKNFVLIKNTVFGSTTKQISVEVNALTSPNNFTAHAGNMADQTIIKLVAEPTSSVEIFRDTHTGINGKTPPQMSEFLGSATEDTTIPGNFIFSTNELEVGSKITAIATIENFDKNSSNPSSLYIVPNLQPVWKNINDDNLVKIKLNKSVMLNLSDYAYDPNKGHTAVLKYQIDSVTKDNQDITNGYANYGISLSGIDFTFNTNQLGIYKIIFKATDELGASGLLNVTFDVNDKNTTPVFVNPPQEKTVVEGQEVKFILGGIDPEVTAGDQTLTFSIKPTSQITGMTLNSATGEFIWIPGFEQAGLYPVEFAVSDGINSSEWIVNIIVNNKDRSPKFASTLSPTIIEEEKSVNVVLPNVTHEDTDEEIIYTVTGLPTWLVFDESTKTIVGTAPKNSAGTYLITFTVTDNSSSKQGGADQADKIDWSLIVQPPQKLKETPTITTPPEPEHETELLSGQEGTDGENATTGNEESESDKSGGVGCTLSQVSPSGLLLLLSALVGIAYKKKK